MFAVVQVGSTQYVVNEKDEILVDRLDMEEGKNFMIEKVLLVGEDDGKKVQIGTPFLDKAKVEARVMGEEKGEKLRIFKMKPKKRYERVQGHRSVYTRIKILKLSMLSGAAKKEPAVAAAAKPAAKKPAAKKPAAKKPVAKKD
jgi:large subunit ribosomal protein L21